MFGHQDETTQSTTNDQATVGPTTDVSSTAASSADTAAPVTSDTDYLLDAHADDGQTGAPAVEAVEAAEVPTPAPTLVAPAVRVASSASDSLIDLKQKALQQLSPLVGQLEQTPEEKFRTTMMLIQASDNQELLQAAYEAANQITDEKARAQALLDVINEINYFSQSQTK